MPGVGVDRGPAIHPGRRLEAELAPRTPVSDVGAAEEAEVVGLESRGRMDEARLEPRDPASVFADLELRAGAGKRRARRVHARAVVRLLVVVCRAPLRARDRLRAPA